MDRIITVGGGALVFGAFAGVLQMDLDLAILMVISGALIGFGVGKPSID